MLYICKNLNVKKIDINQKSFYLLQLLMNNPLLLKYDTVNLIYLPYILNLIFYLDNKEIFIN